jgi:hypothetical protein
MIDADGRVNSNMPCDKVRDCAIIPFCEIERPCLKKVQSENLRHFDSEILNKPMIYARIKYIPEDLSGENV